MQGIDNRRLALSFKWGFIADGIVEVIQKYKNGSSITEKDIEVLNSARNLLDMIVKGEEEAISGVFNMYSLESIKIFNRSMSIINTENFFHSISDKKISNFVMEMNSSLQSIINNEMPEKEYNTELKFFELLRQLTLDESGGVIDNYYESRGLRKWSNLPKSTY